MKISKISKLALLYRNSIIFIGFALFLFILFEYKDHSQRKIITEQSNIITAFNQSPNFHWIKDNGFVMLDLNDSYEETLLSPYGISRNDYIGFTDFDIWDEMTANIFRNFDKEVLECMCPIYRREIAILGEDTIQFKTVKFPVMFSDSTIGIGGTAFFNFE